MQVHKGKAVLNFPGRKGSQAPLPRGELIDSGGNVFYSQPDAFVDMPGCFDQGSMPRKRRWRGQTYEINKSGNYCKSDLWVCESTLRDKHSLPVGVFRRQQGAVQVQLSDPAGPCEVG